MRERGSLPLRQDSRQPEGREHQKQQVKKEDKETLLHFGMFEFPLHWTRGKFEQKVPVDRDLGDSVGLVCPAHNIVTVPESQNFPGHADLEMQKYPEVLLHKFPRI